MANGISLNKGLYFKNELELQRAMMILMENGFDLERNMGAYSDVEVAMSFENKRLSRYYEQSNTFNI